MVLQLTSELLQVLYSHAARTYPEECCGLLLGKSKNQISLSFREVHEVWQTQNAWDAEAEALMQEINPQSPDQPLTKTRRYWIDPKDILEGQRYARDRQLDIIGIYHSHTDHPAIPSECDRACAWPQYSYMIVSVQQGKAQDVLSWNLDEQHQFQLEKLIIAKLAEL